MVITVIHNLYKRNPYILETVKLNIKALVDSGTEFQYILFNDNGDREIEDDLNEYLSYSIAYARHKLKYFYSPKNYGKKMCTGGWVGAIKSDLIKGDIIHNIGQDDVMTSLLYSNALKYFKSESDLYFVSSNGYRVDESLKFLGLMTDLRFNLNFRYPIEAFKLWFGIEPPEYKVNRASNYFLASGTMYRKELHNLIGFPDIDNFTGASDFEYWARILFNGYKGHYISEPTWYYRMSAYSAGNEVIDGIINRGTTEKPGHQQYANSKIIEKYTKLVEEQR